eukprot:TRINITY_DN7604_c0_g1_i1.p1 TRINITY_DN7604_c0_g1~~TRINITY_DN7604_c0_g1_i1.p1  ORF type:complete len:472 (+),score=77.29 TRINITY_DN7604_c0_g1_i1:156-1571(+)
MSSLHSNMLLFWLLKFALLSESFEMPSLMKEQQHRILQQKLPKLSLCFERVSDSAVVTFIPHPAGDGRAFISTQSGVISLVKLPPVGSKMAIQNMSTFLDLSSRVWYSGERGLLSLALHPNFLTNGRFFVSYICNSELFPDCQGPCECSNATGCFMGIGSTATCNSNTIIAEYSAGTNPAFSRVAIPREVRRLLNFGRPYGNHNGGDLFFKDGYLYYTSGDGGFIGDPWSFAQGGQNFLGKVLRLDVDKIPPGKKYGIPKDNPFIGQKGIFPEIFALGYRNPWRCDVDSVVGNIFCGDAGENTADEIDILKPGGNYGWNIYEGTLNYTKQFDFGQPVSMKFGKLQWPIFEYFHLCNPQYPDIDCMNQKGAVIIGGIVYRSKTSNSCLYGKYLFNDFLGTLFVGTVYPPKGQNQTYERAKYICAPDSPVPCVQSLFANILWGWGKDFNNEAYWLTDMGIYRLAAATRCKFIC